MAVHDEAAGPRIGSMIARVALLSALWLASASAFAAEGPASARKQAEASMLVTGTIEVDASGKVSDYSLDRQEKLPEAVTALLAKSVPAWEFKPALRNGKAVNARTDMRIRVVAKQMDGDNYLVGIRGASFGERSKPEENVQASQMEPPLYPQSAAKAGVTGTVYLLARVGRDGKVSDVIAEQTNLRMLANEHVLTRWRRVFENAAIERARTWAFTPPTQGEEAPDQFWVVRVPVVFNLGPRPMQGEEARYGIWEAYVPGPRQRNPWDDGSEGAGFSPDTLPPGGTYLAGTGPKLLTAPDGG